MIELEPIKDHIAVKQHEAAEQIGRIIVAEQAREQPFRGTVMATGPDVVQIREGVDIVFAQYTGTPVNIDEETFLMMREEEVLAIVR